MSQIKKRWLSSTQISLCTLPIITPPKIITIINPDYSKEGLMLKLKLQFFGHLIRRADSLEKTLMLGKIEGRRRGQQSMRWLDGITASMDMTLGDTEGWGSLACCSQWVQKEIKTWLSYWTTYWHITAQMFNILFFSRIHERRHKGRQRSKQICCSD